MFQGLRFGLVMVGVVSAVGCAAGVDGSGGGESTGVTDGGGLGADVVEIVSGVADRGRDPAVVAIDIAGEGLCTGTLVASNVVLTARHCVSVTSEEVDCPASGPQITSDRAASSLGIWVGDDVTTARLVAKGRELVLPPSQELCSSDVALVVLDRDVGGITPLPVRTHAPSKGDHVRAVGFGKRGDSLPAGTKLLRDHVPILDVSSAEFLVGEATCQGDSGGPALDPSTNEIVGIVSRGGPTCEGSSVHNVYTRADAFVALVKDAIRRGAARSSSNPPPGGDSDAGIVEPVATGGDAGTKAQPSKPPTDLGETCAKGGDCSTGVCVSSGDAPYCSRTCGTGDCCPNGYHCNKTTSGTSVCTKV